MPRNRTLPGAEAELPLTTGGARRPGTLAPLDRPASTRGMRGLIWRRFARHRLALAGSAVMAILVLSAGVAPWATPYDFEGIDLRNLFQGPSAQHILGTDELGHDVLTRVLYAGRISLTVGIVAAAITSAVGASIGLLAGYYRGVLDDGLMRMTDIFISIPPIAVMFVLAKFLGPGLRNIILVLTVFGWMGTARLVRGEVLRLRNLEFVEAARAIGAPDGRVILRHLLPNAIAPIIVSTTLLVGQAILSESTISYFGLGIQPPVPSWGNMLQNAQEYLWTAPWLAIYPGFFIFMTVLALNFIGDGLRDALDPRFER